MMRSFSLRTRWATCSSRASAAPAADLAAFCACVVADEARVLRLREEPVERERVPADPVARERVLPLERALLDRVPPLEREPAPEREPPLEREAPPDRDPPLAREPPLERDAPLEREPP